MMISTRSLSPISRQWKAKAVERIDLRGFQAMQNQIHLGEQIRKRLRLAAKDALGLKNLPILDGLALLLQVLERLDEEAAGAAGRIENHFAELGIDDLDHEADDGARSVKLTGVAGGVAHLLEHGFVEMTEGVDLVAAGEMDAVDFVDHVAEQITVDHPVDGALEDGGDHVAPVTAVGALQAAEIGEEACALWCRRGGWLLRCSRTRSARRRLFRLASQPNRASGKASSRAGRKRLPLILASSSRICSMSSRNFRNITQVSIGSRSRSPLSPLSFRMMSRHDFTIEESRWAVVNGWEFLDLIPRAITS